MAIEGTWPIAATEDTRLAMLGTQVAGLLEELSRRTEEHNRVLPYVKRVDGVSPIPAAVTAARLEKAYRHLMAMAEMPWGKLIIASKLDRLEVNGVTSPDESVSDAVWEQVWQDNRLDLDSQLAHKAALLDGRAHATVWPRGDRLWLDNGGTSDGPGVDFDDCTTMIVEYREGSRRDRVAALRRWVDDEDRQFATLFRPDGIYKFAAARGERETLFSADGLRWGMREVDNETWPLANPLGVVPVVEIGVNRELAPGRFTVCTGEFSEQTGLMDRINLLTFLGLAVAVSMSFPLRILIGDKILRDDDGNPLPPFDAYVGGVAHFEDPSVKITEFKAADRDALSIYDELAQLAAATSTPQHYFPRSGAIANVSAETIRAFEGPLHAAVKSSLQPSLGEAHEEILRLGGAMLPEPVILSRRASLSWADHESRSLAERADAFSKITGEGLLPWQAGAEIALGLGSDAIQRYEAEMAGSALAQLITAAREPAAVPPVAPAAA